MKTTLRVMILLSLCLGCEDGAVVSHLSDSEVLAEEDGEVFLGLESEDDPAAEGTRDDDPGADVWGFEDPDGGSRLPDEPDAGFWWEGDARDGDAARFVEEPVERGGTFLAACDDNEDCMSKLCVDVGGKQVCSQTCFEECAKGWLCIERSAVDGQGNGAICVPEYMPLCRPCTDTADCRRFTGDDMMACVELPEGVGSFCLPLCEAEAGCPGAFQCAPEGVCVPESGECSCKEAGWNSGYTTFCSIENAFGNCSGERMCTEEGLADCSAQVPKAELCNGKDDDCDGLVDEQIIAPSCDLVNEYGTCQGMTACVDSVKVCKGQEAEAESCDGKDNDCDGEIDEKDAVGCNDLWPDVDGDGHGDGTGYSSCMCGALAGWVKMGSDCNDADPQVYFGAPEICDGKDNDCDAIADDGCDKDGDGWCNVAPLVFGPQYECEHGQVDCNDASSQVHPDAAESCDGLDEDCDGQVDEGCDMDGDGYCALKAIKYGGGYACKFPEQDCDDGNPAINPSVPEICDGLDQNCDGKIDGGCDEDKDGYCAGVVPKSVEGCYMPGGGLVAQQCKQLKITCPKAFGDCNDKDAGVHPSAVETCDNKDEDCDGLKDEQLDKDGDGYCPSGTVVKFGCVKCKLGAVDCNDASASVHPNAIDPPDELSVDLDCDGFDMKMSATVFVDGAKGSNGNPGTLAAPLKTIQAGIDKAASDVNKLYVAVAKGTYNESLQLKDGVSVWGGYDPAKGWKAPDLLGTKVQGGATAVTGKKLTGGVSLGRLEVYSASATQPGQSSIGLLLVDSLGVELRRVIVWAAKGKDGAEGAAGKAGESGASGKSGASGCIPSNVPGCNFWGTDNSCPGFAAGGSGSGMTCGGRGDGLGDIPKSGKWDPDAASKWSGVGEGEPSCCWKMSYGFGGGAGVAGGKEAWGWDGGNGQEGEAGADGKGGDGKGMINESGWTGSAGVSGKDVTDACGGGGGGMGGRKDDASLTCDAEGGGGGGGGAGGTHGTAGKGGSAGGASIAVLLLKSKVTIDKSTLHASAGGKGGVGGNAGAGGKGGWGGEGGKGYKGSAKGGWGGDGGDAGRGGAGGGGSGGVSAAIVHSASYKPTVTATVFEVGLPGEGGQGGIAYSNYSPPACKGAKGASAQILPVY